MAKTFHITCTRANKPQKGKSGAKQTNCHNGEHQNNKRQTALPTSNNHERKQQNIR